MTAIFLFEDVCCHCHNLNRMMEIEPLTNNGRALRNITDGNPLRQNDNESERHFFLFFVVQLPNAESTNG